MQLYTDYESSPARRAALAVVPSCHAHRATPVDRGQGDVYDRFFCIMWTIAFFSYMGMVGLPAFSMEKAVAAKEITNGMYGLGEYCVALAIVQLPICYLLGTIASAGPYW